MPVTEAELMQQYLDGDANAFRELYARLAPKLRSYLLRLSRSPAVADDLLQVTFLKVHKNRGAWNAGADPKPWIFAIGHRTFLDHARKTKRARVAVATDPERSPEAVAGFDGNAAGAGQEAIYDAELVKSALAALEVLPETQREAVVLTKLEGKTVVEAAAIAGTTVGAMKVRAHRGYAALRKLLAKETP